MPSIEEWNRQADQLNWLAQHGMGGLGPLVNELPQWARGQVKMPGAGGLPAGAGAPIGGPGSGALPGSYSAAHGGIPQTLDPTDALSGLLSGIGGNLGALGPIIGGITSTQNKALRDQYPTGYFDALNTQVGNIGERAKGNIADLLPQFAQTGAEWGIGQGVSGPALQSKLARDVLGGAYNVQRNALQDQATLQNLIPRVAPYDPSKLLPDFGEYAGWKDVGNVRGAAPVPAAAAAEAERLARLGLHQGYGAGFNPGAGFNFNPGGQFLPVGQGVPTPGAFQGGRVAVAPLGPGWFGEDPNVIRGGVPGIPQPPVGGPGFFEGAGNIWDTPFDMPMLPGGDIEADFYDF